MPVHTVSTCSTSHHRSVINSRCITSEHQVRPSAKSSVASRLVVAVKGVSSSAKVEDLCEDKLLSGDIVQEVKGGDVTLVAPFAGGRKSLQMEFRRLHAAGESVIQLKVKRVGGKFARVRANIVPDEALMLKRQYVLRAENDSNHVVTLVDSTENECLALQETRCAHLVTRLANTQLKDEYVPYSIEDQTGPTVQTSSMLFSLLVLPYTGEDSSSNDLEDTVARAMSWFSAAKASGVSILFLNIQTEPLLTKVSGEEGLSRRVSQGEDLVDIINSNVYGFEDYHGIDIGIVRAVRLWYVPELAEIAVVLRWEEGQSRLGLDINRTSEGFCYVSFVENGTIADRAGLKTLYQAARAAGRQLVITRVGDEKITPSMVSSSGSIRCFDTTSIGQRLSVYKQANYPVCLHLIVWEAELSRRWEPTAEGWEGSKPDCYEACEGRCICPDGFEREFGGQGIDGVHGHASSRSSSDNDTNSEGESASFDFERDLSSFSEYILQGEGRGVVSV